uniref:Uncharacterized protein n=1 Tax=Arundo donax TaxID=35708 RepID=A0A0A8ZXE5_ARUDO
MHSWYYILFNHLLIGYAFISNEYIEESGHVLICIVFSFSLYAQSLLSDSLCSLLLLEL